MIGRSTSISRLGCCTGSDIGLTRRGLNLLGADVVMLDLDDGFPVKACGIAYEVQVGSAAAVEDGVQPIVLAQALRRAVLIGAERHLPD